MAIILGLSSTTVSAKSSKALVRADRLYKEAEFESAITAYQKVLDEKAFATEEEHQRALLHLSFSHYMAGHKDEATLVLKNLLKGEPDTKVDPVWTHPELVKFFEKTHKEVSASGTSTGSKGARKPVGIKTGPSKQEINWWALVPFGVGQFAVGDYLGGSLFAVAEVGLLATNLAIHFDVNSKTAPGSSNLAVDTAKTLVIVEGVMGILFYATVAFGILDAFLWAPGRGADDEQASVSIEAGPTGFTLRF